MTGPETAAPLPSTQWHTSLFYRPAALLVVLLVAWGIVSWHDLHLPLLHWMGRADAVHKPSLPPHTRSIVDWAADPDALAYLTPHSHCMINAGVVHLSPARDSRLPFAFDMSSLPTKNESCSHCPPDDVKWPFCCGVCHFSGRLLCDLLYPGQNRSVTAAKFLMSAGHQLRGFSPCELFQRIRGRTLWLMGDSQTLNFYYALECFLREFAPSLRRTPPIPEAENQKLITVRWPRHYPPACLQLAAATRVCIVRVDAIKELRELLFPAFKKHLPNFKQDLVVFNFGLHYPRPGLFGEAADASLLYQGLVRHALWWDKEREQLPKMIWMDTPVQHFISPTGARPPNTTMPYKCAAVQASPVAAAGGPFNAPIAGLIPHIADAHLRTWAASAPLLDTHLPDECTHWCHPSAYQLWMLLLNDLLRDSQLGNKVAQPQPLGKA